MLAVLALLVRDALRPALAAVVDAGDGDVGVQAAIDLAELGAASQLDEQVVEFAVGAAVGAPFAFGADRPLHDGDQVAEASEILVGEARRRRARRRGHSRAARISNVSATSSAERLGDEGAAAGLDDDEALGGEAGEGFLDRGEADVEPGGEVVGTQALAGLEDLREDALAEGVEDEVARRVRGGCGRAWPWRMLKWKSEI